MKKIYLLFLLNIAFATSCTDLSEDIYDAIPVEKFPENDKQAALISVPVYSPMKDLLDWGGWWFSQELPGDDVVCPTRLTDWDDGGKWRVLHTHEWTNETEAVTGMWGKFYEGIVEANQIIESLASAEQNSTTLQVISEVKTMRAFYYYLLIDNYGDVPYVTSFADADPEPMKNTRAEVYTSLVQDLEEAVLYLKNENIKTLATKQMANSLLAKLYLNAEVYSGQAEWAKAEAKCDSIIASGFYSLEANALAPFVTNNEKSSENIFTIPFDRDNLKGFNLHMRTLHYNHNETFDLTVGTWNGFAVTEDHFNSFSDDDARKEGFLYGPQFSSSGAALIDGTTGTPVVINPVIPALVMDASYTSEEIRMSGARVAKFEIASGANDNLSNDFPVFRYADVLLMKAEAMIRQGKNGDEYVNMVRERAGVDAWTNTSLDQLLEERSRELYWEGHRRQDLIRFGKFGDSWWEKAASSADRETYPIPLWATQGNPNLEL
ncbi:RagB/SusD family nutrient uptake outer membrane protein [Sediminitomix flava]|uniref:SusD-like starch-binding protein associating with outer membrane n=1 Tax=Sediminitomix flava TaxID=379075 RepID=A0A315ZBF5_SEDFL|nr:RagB/SusD family nutrient uptake outer membrane protein [Sediminitomix flava]PWJ42489.1 SusD-like starch-binding protein associating with outer membrane [Sediminitomix flava]